jgi:hypothetical protein
MARLAMDTVQEVERVAAEWTRRDSLKLVDGTQTPTTTEETQVSNHDLQGSDNSVHPHQQHQQHHLANLSQPQLDQGVPPHFNNTNPLPGPGDQLDPNFFSGFDGEAGIFGNFDPNFDLSRIDAIFSANLDPSAPPFTNKWLGGPVPFTWDDASQQ